MASKVQVRAQNLIGPGDQLICTIRVPGNSVAGFIIPLVVFMIAFQIFTTFPNLITGVGVLLSLVIYALSLKWKVIGISRERTYVFAGTRTFGYPTHLINTAEGMPKSVGTLSYSVGQDLFFVPLLSQRKLNKAMIQYQVVAPNPYNTYHHA